jgi:amino acid transporter
MKKIAFIFLFIFVTAISIQPAAKAQCAMCTINAEQGTKNGNTQGKGINDGVLYLMALPYLLIAGLGVLWYVRYHKKSLSHD